MDFLDLLELVLVTEPGIHACNLEESNTYYYYYYFLTRHILHVLPSAYNNFTILNRN